MFNFKSLINFLDNKKYESAGKELAAIHIISMYDHDLTVNHEVAKIFKIYQNLNEKQWEEFFNGYTSVLGEELK